LYEKSLGMKRTRAEEFFDGECGAADVATALNDLRHINSWFGGNATSEAMIEQVAEQRGAPKLSLLEAASGSGEVTAAAKARLAPRGLDLEVTLLDRAWSHLYGNGNGHHRNGRRMVVGDALAIPFEDGSFDLVSCGLFAHHLSPEQLTTFVNEGLRVCRVAVLINDLVRHPLHLGLAYLSLPLYRSYITRHDAPASVRAAYTVEEMQGLLRQTHAARVEICRHRIFRMGVIAWKA